MEEPNCIHRPELNAFPPLGLPIYPRSIGLVCRTANDTERTPAGIKPFVQLFWGVEGEGEFERIAGNPVLGPGDVLLRYPGDPHIFGPRGGRWVYRWVAFDGPFAAGFARAYRYPDDCFAAGACPHGDFQEFSELMRNRSPANWRRMVTVIARIFEAAGGRGDEPGIVRRAVALCRKRYADPGWNVNALAETLGVGRGALLAAFKREMRLPISEYLAQVRLQAALELLSRGTAPLHEIAGRCGFSDVNYFCRFIKRRTGRKPSQLR